MPPPAEPPRPPGKAGAGNPLTRKLGPAPVYVWVAVAAVTFLLYRHFATGSGAGGGLLGGSGLTGTTSNPSGSTDTGASGGGGATAIDSLPADLIAQLFGTSAALNSQLVDALVNTNAQSAGLAQSAESALFASYTPQSPQPTVVTAPSAAAPVAAAPAPLATSSVASKAAASPSPMEIILAEENPPGPYATPQQQQAANAAASQTAKQLAQSVSLGVNAPSSAPAVKAQATGKPPESGYSQKSKANLH